jgi:hypothetical protein
VDFRVLGKGDKILSRCSRKFFVHLSRTLNLSHALSCKPLARIVVQIAAMTKQWIESKREGKALELKVAAQGGGSVQRIEIVGGLPSLPGTSVIMPVMEFINGHGQELPAPATDATPTESVPEAKDGS